MKRLYITCFWLLLTLPFLQPSNANAETITLLPGDINGGDTNTSSFTDINGLITLTPTIGGSTTGATFNANAGRLGIDGQGTNNNGFGGNEGGGGTGEYDTVFGNADDEGLLLDFSATAGFAGISWDFTRADGPAATDGIQFSGFLADPGAVITGEDGFDNAGNPRNGADGVTSSYANGVLTLQIDGRGFIPQDGILTLTNTGASAGQLITMTVADSDQTGALFAVTSISFDNDTVAVPEPSSMAIIGLTFVGFLASRKRRLA